MLDVIKLQTIMEITRTNATDAISELSALGKYGTWYNIRVNFVVAIIAINKVSAFNSLINIELRKEYPF